MNKKIDYIFMMSLMALSILLKLQNEYVLFCATRITIFCQKFHFQF